jgi:hypothetical protein
MNPEGARLGQNKIHVQRGLCYLMALLLAGVSHHWLMSDTEFHSTVYASVGYGRSTASERKLVKVVWLAYMVWCLVSR